MKAKEIASRYNFDRYQLEMFLYHQDKIKVRGFNSDVVADEDVQRVVELFQQYLDEQARQEKEKAEVEAEKQRKLLEQQQACARMLITSGFNFDGYTIKRYSGYISGDDAVQIDRGDLFAENGQMLTDALVKIRIQALKELKEAAYDLGCNAVIGVDFDYMTFEPETANITGGTTYQPYVVCVTANGNAVVIEKN